MYLLSTPPDPAGPCQTLVIQPVNGITLYSINTETLGCMLLLLVFIVLVFISMENSIRKLRKAHEPLQEASQESQA